MLQMNDSFCLEVRRRIKKGDEVAFVEYTESGLLMRHVYEYPQTVIPASLRKRVLQLAHRPAIAGHCGGRRMYRTLRRNFTGRQWHRIATEPRYIVEQALKK